MVRLSHKPIFQKAFSYWTSVYIVQHVIFCGDPSAEHLFADIW